MPSGMAAWYVSLFLLTRNMRPTLMIRNMRSSQNINICCGSAEPVPLTPVPLTPGTGRPVTVLVSFGQRKYIFSRKFIVMIVVYISSYCKNSYKKSPWEHQLYLFFYHPSKKLIRAPFDLCAMVMLHGYVLLDLGRAEEAVSVLEDAIRYNPLNPDPYFEMAECYKYLKQPEDLLGVTKETLSIATTPVTLSRCYCNLGFYCIEKKDYDSAVCFYYESLIYADHPGVQAELHHIHTITQKKIVPPTREEVNKAFEKYGMQPGANKEVVGVAAALAKEAIEKKDLSGSQFYLLVVYSLTNDPEVKELLEKVSPKKKAAKTEAGEKPIQQTK